MVPGIATSRNAYFANQTYCQSLMYIYFSPNNKDVDIFPCDIPNDK